MNLKKLAVWPLMLSLALTLLSGCAGGNAGRHIKYAVGRQHR